MKRRACLVNTAVYLDEENDKSKAKNKNCVWKNKTFSLRHWHNTRPGIHRKLSSGLCRAFIMKRKLKLENRN